MAQVFYGVIILAVTTFNALMYRSLAAIPENKDVMVDFMAKRKWVPYDIAIKSLGQKRAHHLMGSFFGSVVRDAKVLLDML